MNTVTPADDRLVPECPHPEKVRFATREVAQQRAHVRWAITGVDIHTYNCRCGWRHLTSQPQWEAA